MSLRGELTLAALVALLVVAPCSANVVCGETIVQGIDVSHFTGPVDWNQVKASGLAFAFTKATEGDFFIDPTFDQNYAGIKAAGMIRGAYHYFRPAVDPIAQANSFLAKVGTLGPGDLPPALVVEVTDGQSGAVIASGIQSWVSAVQQALGRSPIIFTARSFWNSNVGAANDSSLLWIAQWGVFCPTLPSAWQNWTFWQYSDTGLVSGVNGRVDVNYFNGSLADLQQLAGIQIVSLEIKPGDASAAINPNSNGITPVAILSTAAFDASTAVDVSSLTFGHSGTEQSLVGCAAEDVNGDGLPDLLCRFRTRLAGFQAGDTTAALQGRTVTNIMIVGTGAIRLVPNR